MSLSLYSGSTGNKPAYSSAHFPSVVTSTLVDIPPYLSGSGSSLIMKRKSLVVRARRLRMRELSGSGPCQPTLRSSLAYYRLVLWCGLDASNGLRRLSLLRLAWCCSIASSCDSSGDGADERRVRASASSRSSASGGAGTVVAVADVVVTSASVSENAVAAAGKTASGASVVACISTSMGASESLAIVVWRVGVLARSLRAR